MTTYVHAALVRAPLLAPADLRRLALPEAEHTQHVPNPARDAHHEPDLDVAPGRLEIHVRARDELAEDVDRLGGVERVAERSAERRLARVEAVVLAAW